ncbi:hypothetical protein [Paludifilum halophilum]|uniref:DUF4878 domain-containing protein n=1 Tax=Paludifilum halophilum TaxID=1642702 RepID=A0A235B4L2_9BACL|nr:hypothetical protein [Paludifilum halophilum]OYD06899.1 hypothetical protein CHM34_13235 [Paludifilum halophilum]
MEEKNDRLKQLRFKARVRKAQIADLWKMLSKRAKIILCSLAGVFLLAVLLLIVSFGSNSAEETAIDFYQAVYVEGDSEAAKELLYTVKELDEMSKTERYELMDSLNAEIKEAMKQSPKEKRDSSVLIGEDPSEGQTDAQRTYYIHRSADDRDFYIRVNHYDGDWKVEKYKQEDSEYEELIEEYEDLKENMKEIHP